MKTPRISLVAMDARDPAKVFVRIPNEPGRWVLTDRCVVEVECGQCEAAIGEPCHNGHGKYWQGTHCVRRGRWHHRSSRQERATPHEEEIEENLP